MIQAFLTDALTVLLILVIFALSVAACLAVASEIIQKKNGNKALKKVDEMYREYGEVDEKDRLNTWYEIRNRISGDKTLTPKERRELYEAVQGRILECKAKAKYFSWKGRLDGKAVIFFNQN